MSKDIDEKKTAGASYIIQFYQEVQNLNHNYSTYLNLMLDLEAQYGKEYADKLTEEDITRVREGSQSTRYGIHKSYIQYMSIIQAIKTDQEEIKSIKDTYAKLKNAVIINRDYLENYVILMNSFLLKGIVQELLATSQDYVDRVYNAKNS